MFVFAGLGNPGKEYCRTRHNVGFECMDYLSALYRIPITKTKFKSLVGEGIIQGEKVILVKPQTYMNNSGEALREVMDFYKLETQKIVVIYDDIDLDLGVIRIRSKGGPGTHNGMKSIVCHLGTEDFPRIRVGIGKPAPEQDLINFVLGKYNQDEQRIINEAVERVSVAAGELITAGIETAMSKCNGK